MVMKLIRDEILGRAGIGALHQAVYKGVSL